ncbi:hypothetical protein ORIO_09900 [Cereibacter azotoformans]|uniref:hypothetical protein n=1 Tax=Cereibacter azotoformans TaxID=43057 RepID=UPI001EEA69D7|nr:hypothetical protein [Cereibacter azotoformans]ULB10216.1 hypothetical protein ORIO_09900 [Cereibacter azotoformans]
MTKKRISELEAAFLKFELDSQDARRQKTALQDLCRRYRGGHVLPPELRRDFEVHVGYLAVNGRDPKVVRWSLNTIARLGTQQGAANSVTAALVRHGDSPEIVGAAIAALAALYRGVIPALPSNAPVPPEVRTLAAMQTVNAAQLGSTQLKIDIDQADADLLKLALIVIGLNRDIQNLLHPSFDNGQIVRALGQHDDATVRQYSVWAVIENRVLGLEHLGIPFERTEHEPENVQAKLLELGASTIIDPTERQNLILAGSSFASVLAREGLAKGLLRSFYDGLGDIMLDWVRTEAEHRVRVLLAEHFGRYADRMPSYEEMAFELALEGGDLRRYVLRGADGKPLQRRLQIEEPVVADLFADDVRTQRGLIGMIQEEAKTKVLILAATPDDQSRIRPDKEVAELRERMAAMPSQKRSLAFDSIYATRLDQIQQELVRQRPKILHFSGHGAPGCLMFETTDGRTAPLEADLLARVLKGYRDIECLVLHACYAEEVARACLPYVACVVGSTTTVNDATAPRFSYLFYQSIAAGMGYEQAFEMGQTEVAFMSRNAADAYKLIIR